MSLLIYKGVESVKWMLNRPGGGGSNVKAFSGAGRTLGGGARSELKPSQFDSELKTLDQVSTCTCTLHVHVNL